MEFRKRFPLWALLWGCILSAGINFIQARYRNGMTADFVCADALLGLFLMAFILNPVLSIIKKTWALSSSEMLLVYIMGAVACVLPTWGLMANLLPIIGGLTYYATPTNKWAETVLIHIRHWFIPTNSAAVESYFTGAQKGSIFPYFAWITPLAAWFLFLMSFFFLSICIAVMLRKQWDENEKLVFPLALLPADMVKKPETGKLPLLFKNRLFWIGFAITFGIVSINTLRSYFPIVPGVGVWVNVPIFRNTTYLMFVLSWPIFGFSYLVNLNITFSLFFFHFCSKIETGIFNITGYTIPGHAECFDASSPMVAFQGAGSVIVLFIAILWQARRHLSNVFRKAFCKDSDIDDSLEILSYRTVVFGGAVSILVMGGFLYFMGMPLLLTFIYLFYLLATFVVLNRVICQAGLGFARSQCPPPSFVSYALPPGAITPSGYAGIGLQYPYAGDIRTTVLTSTQNSLKINEESRINPRFLFWAIIIALVIAYVSSAFSTLQNGYINGELNQHPWFSQYFPHTVGDFIADKINNPPTKDIILTRYLFTGIGAAIMGILIFMQNKFLWWPLHYIGFPIADSLPIDRGWFSIFLAWLIKFVVLRYGGVQLYRRLIPFFYGIIIGSVVASGAWLLVGYIYHIVTGEIAVFPGFGI